MADLSKFKKPRGLGIPPSLDEASPNLAAPETAPIQVSAPAPAVIQPVAPVMEYQRRDGRSARKTGRTLAFATRVSMEFDQKLREIAERDDLRLVEVLELALDAYEVSKSNG